MASSIIRNIIAKFSRSHRFSARKGTFEPVPQELLDLIICYLADDKATLLSCALVHPTWTSISRYHLQPVTLVVCSRSRSKKSIKLLSSPRETLSSSITGITLIGYVPFDSAMRGTSYWAQSYLKLFQLMKAKHVALRSGAVETDPSLVALFAQYFPTLTEMKVTCRSYQDITSFMRALSGSFSRLTGLGIELGSGQQDIVDAPLSGLRDVTLRMPCLRTLRVVGWNNDFMNWLGINVSGTLVRLELENCSVWSICHVGEAHPLLRMNKETLRDLRLSFMRRDVALDLLGLTRLRYLEVTSGIIETLDGRLLPRSLEKLSLRKAAFAGIEPSEECIVEGPALQKVLGL